MMLLQLGALLTMLATGHCHKFIIATEYSAPDCDPDNMKALEPFADPVGDGTFVNYDSGYHTINHKYTNSIINYNYYAEDACVLAETGYYKLASPYVFACQNGYGTGIVALTEDECAALDGKVIQGSDWTEFRTAEYKGAVDLPSPHACGCHVDWDNNLDFVNPQNPLEGFTGQWTSIIKKTARLFFNRKDTDCGPKKNIPPYNIPQVPICKKVEENDITYARMTCGDTNVVVNVYKEDDVGCRGEIIGHITREKQCKMREDRYSNSEKENYFPTYIKYTCGTEMQAMRLRAYGGENCEEKRIWHDHVWPLGTCMGHFSRAYFEEGNDAKSVNLANRRRRGCSGGSGHHVWCNSEYVKGKYFGYETLSFKMATYNILEQRIEKESKYESEQGHRRRTIAYSGSLTCDAPVLSGSKYRDSPTVEVEQFKLDCSGGCSKAEYRYLDAYGVNFRVQREGPDGWEDKCPPSAPYTTVLPTTEAPGATTQAPSTEAPTEAPITDAPTTEAPTTQAPKNCARWCENDKAGWVKKCSWVKCRGCAKCKEHCVDGCKTKNLDKPWSKKCTWKTCKFCPACNRCRAKCKPKAGQTWAEKCKKSWCKACEECEQQTPGDSRRMPTEDEVEDGMNRRRSMQEFDNDDPDEEEPEDTIAPETTTTTTTRNAVRRRRRSRRRPPAVVLNMKIKKMMWMMKKLAKRIKALEKSGKTKD